MKFNLILIFFLQIFGLYAETVEICMDPIEICELKFEKDIFSSEERNLITKDIHRMFFVIRKRTDIIKKNIFTGEYSFTKVPPEAFPKNFTKYLDFEEGKTNFVFILNSKGCDAYKKAFDFRYKHKEEIKKLEEFNRALHKNEFYNLPREEQENFLYYEKSDYNNLSLNSLLHHEFFEYYLQPPLCLLDTRYVTFPDGKRYLTWFFCLTNNQWGEFETHVRAQIYHEGRWKVVFGKKNKEFLLEEYKQWVLSGEE